MTGRSLFAARLFIATAAFLPLAPIAVPADELGDQLQRADDAERSQVEQDMGAVRDRLASDYERRQAILQPYLQIRSRVNKTNSIYCIASWQDLNGLPPAEAFDQVAMKVMQFAYVDGQLYYQGIPVESKLVKDANGDVIIASVNDVLTKETSFEGPLGPPISSAEKMRGATNRYLLIAISKGSVLAVTRNTGTPGKTSALDCRGAAREP